MVIILIIYALIAGIILGLEFFFFSLLLIHPVRFQISIYYKLKVLLSCLFIAAFWPINVPIFLIWPDPITNWITKHNHDYN